MSDPGELDDTHDDTRTQRLPSADELRSPAGADTMRELAPVPASSADNDPVTDADYFDRDASHPRAPRNRDLEGRVAANEGDIAAIKKQLPELRRSSRLRRYGIPTLSGLLGVAGAVLVYALAFARDAGDARATAREREAERAWLVKAVRDDLIPEVAGLKADVRSLREMLRFYLPAGALRLQGPAEPPTTTVTP